MCKVLRIGYMMLVANWKMHGSKVFARDFCQKIKQMSWPDGLEVVVLPPAIYLSAVADVLAGSAIKWGAQHCHQASEGAFTGELSAAMLADMKCAYVLIGHSERRTLFAESDALVAQKWQAAHEVGVRPILCVGESLKEREQGQTEAVIKRQLGAVMDAMQAAQAPLVVAYEPVWAIGTGLAASPEQAQQVHALVRAEFAYHDQDVAKDMQILYGGSVKPSNASALFEQNDIDGALVGGASLVVDGFFDIGEVCNKSF
jgi:triosephosphate isomerase (TIM)